MNFCSDCGSKVVFDLPPGDDRPRYRCTNCDTVHYQNPLMVVGCIPVWQDELLLCKRAIDPQYGTWTLPAGYLENGETVEDLDDLPAGEYTVVISDANGCNFAVTIEVGQPSPLVANITTTPVTSAGAEDGTASVQPIGGTPPFEYQWETGHQTSTVDELEVGSYTVTITDANGNVVNIIATDVQGTNGIIHVLDAVILP